MSTTISTISAASSNTINALSAWEAQDGTYNGNPESSMADITMLFDDLAVPSGATIDGFELIIYGQGNSGTNPGISISVDGSSSWSNVLLCNTSWSKTDTTRTYGGSTNLWGLSSSDITVDGANGMEAKIDMSTLGFRQLFYWDFIQMKVYYSLADFPVTLMSGKITLTSGKVTIGGI